MQTIPPAYNTYLHDCRFGIAADPPCTEQEKQLTAWGYAFIGLGYLAIMEAMYLAYKRYNADVGKMQYGEDVSMSQALGGLNSVLPARA